jgi:hypothetical protein
MSIDRYYTKIDGQWTRADMRVIDGKRGSVPSDEWQSLCTDSWVDICHGGGILIDERYYFADLASALDFYLEGWKERQYLDDNGEGVGLDHSGLYSRGRLIHGKSIHGDAPGHEGENLRQVCEQLARKMDENQNRS